MRIRDLLSGGLLVLIGFVAGNLEGLGAQEADTGDRYVAGAWEIQSAPYGQQSWYAIKHNTVTGETLILDARKGAENDAWLLLPLEDKTGDK